MVLIAGLGKWESHEENRGISILMHMENLDLSYGLPSQLKISSYKLPNYCLVGFLETYLQVFNQLFQLFSTHEGLCRWNTPFSFFQPFLEGPNQFSELIQLLLAR